MGAGDAGTKVVGVADGTAECTVVGHGIWSLIRSLVSL